MGTAGNSNALLMWSKMRRARIINDPITQARWYAPRFLNMICSLSEDHPFALISSLAAYPLLLVQSVIRCLDLLICSRLILNVPSCPLSQCLEKDVNHLATFFGATSHNIVDLTVVSLSNWSNPDTLLIKFNQWSLKAPRFNFQSGQKQSTRSWLPW